MRRGKWRGSFLNQILDTGVTAMYGENTMDPRAAKRFNNDRTRAAQSALMGQSAKSSIPDPSMRGASNRPQAMQQQQPVQQMPQANPPMQQHTAQLPGQSAPDVASIPQFSPEETIQNNMDLEKFLSSPEMQQSIARSRLRKYFKRNDPSGVANDVAADALQSMLQSY